MVIYDGKTINDPLIGPFCGQKRNLIVYSSGENLLVVFKSLSRNADHQNRGYSANFNFSEKYINLAFIKTYAGEHIRGTECDQKISSKGETNGTLVSPNYPFFYNSNTVCKYHLYGLDDENHLEKVRLDFEKFEIPVVKEGSKTASETPTTVDGNEDEVE